MLTSHKLKCPNNNTGTTVCTTQKCLLSAISCSDENCPCQSHHQNCINSTSIKVIINKLIVKDNSTKPCYEIAIEYLDELIKEISIQKYAIKKAMETGRSLLEANEEKFWGLIEKENSSEEVTGNLMFHVAQSVIRNPKIDEKEAYEKINKKVEEAKKQVGDLFNKLMVTLGIEKEEVKIKPQQKISFAFSKTLKGRELTLNQKTNRVKINGSETNFVLMQTSIACLGEKQITLSFRVVQCRYLYIGIAKKPALEAKDFVAGVINQDYGHFVSTGGRITSSIVKNLASKGDGFDDQDILYLRYNGKTKKMKLINVTQKYKEIELSIDEDNEDIKNEDLYFGMAMYQGAFKTEIEYLGIIEEKKY